MLHRGIVLDCFSRHIIIICLVKNKQMKISVVTRVVVFTLIAGKCNYLEFNFNRYYAY